LWPDSTPTQTASPVCRASRSAQDADRARELEHGRAQRVLAALGLLDHQSLPLQRAQHGVHRGLGDVDQLRDLGHPEARRTGSEREQDLRGAFNGTCHGYPFGIADLYSA